MEKSKRFQHGNITIGCILDTEEKDVTVAVMVGSYIAEKIRLSVEQLQEVAKFVEEETD